MANRLWRVPRVQHLPDSGKPPMCVQTNIDGSTTRKSRVPRHCIDRGIRVGILTLLALPIVPESVTMCSANPRLDEKPRDDGDVQVVCRGSITEDASIIQAVSICLEMLVIGSECSVPLPRRLHRRERPVRQWTSPPRPRRGLVKKRLATRLPKMLPSKPLTCQ